MICPFCSLPPDRLIATDLLTSTIRDAFPASPGHTLILPRRHIPSLFDATLDEQLAMLRAVTVAKAALDAEHHPDGYNLGINEGPAAGQTIPHLHVHLIPRYTGDTPHPRGGIRHCIPTAGDPLLPQLAHFVLDHEWGGHANSCGECGYYDPIMANGGEVYCGHTDTCETGRLCTQLLQAGYRYRHQR